MDRGSRRRRRAAHAIAEQNPCAVQTVGLDLKVFVLAAAFLEVNDLLPRLLLYEDAEAPLGDLRPVESKGRVRLSRAGESLHLAASLARVDIDTQLASGKDGFRRRLEVHVAVLKTSAGRRPRWYDQVRLEGRGQGEPQRGRRGHGSMEPVADEPAKLDDVLALAGRGQKGLPRLGGQVVGQHVADAAEQLQQHGLPGRRR